MKIRKTGTFSYSLPLGNSSQITIFDCAPLVSDAVAEFSNDFFLGHELFLEAFQLTINLGGLTVAPLPDISVEDSQTERQAKVYDVQRSYPRRGINILTSVGSGGWIRQACPFLQNPGGEWFLPILNPYLTTNPVLCLSADSRLGVQMVDLGSGLLVAGDSIVAHGSYRHEISLVPRKRVNAQLQQLSWSISTASTQLLSAVDRRDFLILQNPSSERVWLGFGVGAQLGVGSYLDPGGSLNLETIVSLQTVSAIAANSATLTGLVSQS